MQHKDIVILNKIVRELDIVIDAITGKTFEEFDNDELFKRGVCMTVINIGELVKNLSDDFRSSQKHIPWRMIAGFRDVAAHKYQTLDMFDVYTTITEDFFELKENILKILLSEANGND